MHGQEPALPATPSDSALLLRVLRRGWRHRRMIAVFLASTALSGALMGWLMSQLAPFLSALSQVMKGSAAVSGALTVTSGADELLGIALRFCLAAPIAAGAAFLSWWAGQWVANRTMRGLRTELLAHLVDLDLAFHAGLNRGDLLTRLTNDLTSTLRTQQYLFGKLLQRPLESAGIIAALFWYCGWQVGTGICVVLVPVVLLILPQIRRTRTRSARARETLAANVGVLEQITAGIKVIKAFGSAARERERYDAHSASLERDNLRLARARALSDAISMGAVFLLAAGGIAAGALLFREGLLTPTQFLVSIAALARLVTSLREVVRTWGDLQEQLPSVARVFALLDRESAVRDAPDARDCPAPRQAIRLEDVRFAYPRSEPRRESADPASDAASSAPIHDADEVLRGVSIEIPIGSTVALVGESGAGKSTILDLIPRLHDVSAGRISIDGVDVRALRQASLVRHVAFVQQDSFLFDDTVRANIAYGRPGASDADIEAAAKRAHVHDTILGLEGGAGYATRVGDRGTRLSGGQRQRIAIARAFLRDAPILLLDEPTSALDADSEHHVRAALAELMRGRTVIIVAHRLATVQHADCIFVLAGRGDPARGTVLESGTHTDLVARGGAYARLVAMQRLG